MHIEPGLVDGTKIVLSYATAAVFCFFELMWHHPVGVSEVHLILGTTLMLALGAAPAAIGLAAGLLIQGLFFAPADLPQYGMNVTTLLVPLFAMAALARRVIPQEMAYVDLNLLAAAKGLPGLKGSAVVNQRLYGVA